VTRQRAMIWACYAGACVILFTVSLSFLQKQPAAGYRPFGTYWASGRAAVHGLNPFAQYPETFISKVPSEPRGLADLNLNPPCTIPFFQLLGHLSLGAFARIWTIASALLFMLTAGVVLWRQPEMQKRQVLWLLLCAPVLDTIHGAQIYGLLLLLCALAWAFREHENAAAIAIGLLVAIKPSMIFWPLFLWVAGHRRIAWRAALVTTITSLLPLLLYGPRIYAQWFTATRGDQHWHWPTDIALMPLLARTGHPRLGVATALLATAALVHWAWKKKPDLLGASGVGICAGILCAPLAWHTYILMVAPFAVARPWAKLSTFAACLLMIPTAFAAAPGSVVYLIALVILLAGFESSAVPVPLSSRPSSWRPTSPHSLPG
jgi:hypothetical protein